MLYRTYTALFALAIALIAWGLVGLFAWTITVDESERVANATDASQSATASASAIRLHALAQDTSDEAAKLKDLLNVDVVSAAYLIEGVGKTAGVTVKLGDAQRENTPSASDALAVQTIGFVVQADGKFPALMRAIQSFETLPIPSSISRLDIEHAPNGSGKSSDVWHMNLYIRVLTTSDISS